MSPSALSALLAIAAASVVLAQLDPAAPTPLYSKHYAYPSGIVSPSYLPFSPVLNLRLAISSRLQHRRHPRSPSRVQHLQLYDPKPEFHVSNVLCKPHRWYTRHSDRRPLD